MLPKSASISDFVDIAAAYRGFKGLSESRVSTLVFNDGTKITCLREGRCDINSSRLQDAMLWFSQNWPEDEEKPRALIDFEARVAVEGSDPDLGDAA